MRASCQRCGKPKSASVVRCPHCGAVDAVIDPRDPVLAEAKRDAPAGPRISGPEAGVLLMREPDRPSFWRDFFLPSPRLHGWLLLVDLVLIVLSLPLVLGIVIGLGQGESPDGEAVVTGHYAENVVIALLGGAIVLIGAYAFDLLWSAIPIVGLAVVALFARAWLRAGGSTS